VHAPGHRTAARQRERLEREARQPRHPAQAGQPTARSSKPSSCRCSAGSRAPAST
jgi:hypothetical protein